jgi:hypothetical protein
VEWIGRKPNYPPGVNLGAAREKANSVGGLRVTAVLPIKPRHFLKHFADFGWGGPA